MIIDIKDLLGSAEALRTSGARIGVPDDPTPVEITEPQRLIDCLGHALNAFRDLRGGADYVVCATINTYHRCVWVRFVQGGPCQDRQGVVEPAFGPLLHDLRAAVAKSRGEVQYWGGNNYFDVLIPFGGPVRESSPDVKHLPWDERYRYILERENWDSLRRRVFRFSNLAESFADRCVEFGLSRVLIPSVGLCVHPWLYAHRGLSVIATDIARSALNVLSEPDHWSRLYSLAAFRRWDIAESASHATQGNLNYFEHMPDLEDPDVRESLRRRITFTPCDWADLPLEDGSVDAIFATNALPRESSADQIQVLHEWIRVVGPGGIVCIAQHNFFDSDVELLLRDAGWVDANILAWERPDQPDAIGFQIHYSSG